MDGAYDYAIMQDKETKEKYIKIRRNTEVDFDFNYDEHDFYDED